MDTKQVLETMDNAADLLDEENMAGGHLRLARAAVVQLVKDAAAKQAKIDALMLEYCPDEMTDEQVHAWGLRQRKVSPEKEAEINKILGLPAIDALLHDKGK